MHDNGPGLADDLLEKVFEPYFRAETSRNRDTGGTGLGLAIARNLVQAQGGRIWLEHGVATGVVVRVWLGRSNAAANTSGVDTVLPTTFGVVLGPTRYSAHTTTLK